MDLLVIDVSVKGGKGRVVLSDQNHDAATARVITLEFPMERVPAGSFSEREARIVEDAQAVLRAADAALQAR